MHKSPSGCHTHHLRGIRLEQYPRSIVQAVFSGHKNGKVSVGKPACPKVQAVEYDSSRDTQPSDEEALLPRSHSLVEKYGTRKEVIGTGGSSIVWASHRIESDSSESLFAIKGFRPQSGGNKNEFRKRLVDEHQMLSTIKHPNVIQALDLVQDEQGELLAVLELCEGGDLYSLLLQRGVLDAFEADCFFKQTMRGVNFLHENNIAHRDLKVENLVLTSRGVIKITDFGESERFRVADVEVAMVGGECGTSPYIAPEVFTSDYFDARSADVWSTGIIYITMRLGRYLWNTAELDDKHYNQYLQDRRTESGYRLIEDLGKAECNNVVYSLIDPKPGRRLTASQFLRTEWGRSIELCNAAREDL